MQRIIEKIEYLTQIHTAWDGTEQRLALRDLPRRYITYEYIGMKSPESQYLRALTNNMQTKLIGFPFWHATRLLTETLWQGASQIELTPEDLWNYRDCMGVLLDGNEEKGQLLIRSISSNGTLRLKKQLRRSYLAYKTVAIPVFYGLLNQEDNYTNLTSNLTDMLLNVELLRQGNELVLPEALDEFHYPRPVFWKAKNAPEEYLGAELFLLEPTWGDDIASSYFRNANRLDNQTGFVRYDLKSKDTTEVKKIAYASIGRADIQFLQRFFYRCKGAWKSFWMPTWLNDIDLAEDALSGSELFAEFDLYWQFYTTNSRRKHVIVFFKDGTIEFLKIAGYTTDETGKRGRIFLENALKRPMRRKDISMISFLCRFRFNSDTLTMDYETTRDANTEIELKEVNE